MYSSEYYKTKANIIDAKLYDVGIIDQKIKTGGLIAWYKLMK